MSSIDLHNEEIGIKVVYYGPGLGGKTSSLQHMHAVLKPENRGRLISLATGIDRTLYFDFLPIQLPKIKNFSVRMSMYTVPGQVHYNATRKLVLQGADGVVFVADSQIARREANIESMENLYENLRTHGMNPDTVPLVIQYNKRDLPEVLTVEELDRDLNRRNVPWFETSATTGQGIFEALKSITKLVLADLKHKGIYREKEDRHAHPSSRSTVTSTVDHHDTSVRISIPDDIRLQSDRDDDTFQFETQETKESENVHTPASRESSDSTSLEDAIAAHAEALPSEKPEALPTSASWFSDLWISGSSRNIMKELEGLLTIENYGEIVRHTYNMLKKHLRDAGGIDATVEEALLALGISGGHYIRFKSTLEKRKVGNVTRQDALFCMFFLTDIELRLQASGIR